MMTMLAAAALAGMTVTAPGPKGALEGTMIDAGKGAPVVVIIPGSGPTDRDGNNPLGITAQPYKLLAEALAERGISSIRVDKRGMFGSKAAVADANSVTLSDYAADAHAWAKVARSRTGAKCAWLVGHSEGGLVALAAALDRTDLCGIVTVSGPGRKFGTILREQLRSNPANAPYLAPAEKALADLESRRPVDASSLPEPLRPLFSPKVQGYLMDLLSKDPAGLASASRVPMLIIQGDRDEQVAVSDAQALSAAQPNARLVIVKGVNHVLKAPTAEGRAASLATYADSSLPIAPAVPDAIAAFVKAPR